MTRCTLAAPASHSLEVKKSRFLAQALSIETGEAALVWLKQIADPTATHNCWAPRKELIELVELELRCAFALSGSVHELVGQLQGQKLAESFDEHGLRLCLRLPASSYDRLACRLRDLSRGAAEIRMIEKPSE
jgi:putative IMPACT (imprinted ancient) family translation regulator